MALLSCVYPREMTRILDEPAQQTQQIGEVAVPTAEPLPGSFDALKEKGFRLFIIGVFISNLGTWLQSVALSWLILETTNSPFLVTLVPAAQFGPMLLLGMPGGVVADRFNRRKVLIATQTLMALDAALLAIVTRLGNPQPEVVLPLVVLGGCALAFNAPAFQAIIGDLVPRRRVAGAVSINSSQFSLSRVIGPAIGGYIVGAGGPANAFAINAFSFIAVIGTLLVIHVRPHERASAISRNSFTAAFKTASEIPVIKTLILVAMVLSMLSAPIMALLPVIARDVLSGGAALYGHLFAAFGLGTAFGAIAVTRFLNRIGYRRLVLIAACMQAGLLAALAFSTRFEVSVALMVVYGTCHGSVLASTASALQLVAPERQRARVMSLFLAAFAGLYPLGAVLSGLVADRWGAEKTLLMTSIALALTVVAGFRWTRRLNEVSHH